MTEEEFRSGGVRLAPKPHSSASLMPGDCHAKVEIPDLMPIMITPIGSSDLMLSQRHAFSDTSESITISKDGLLAIIHGVLLLEEAERRMS